MQPIQYEQLNLKSDFLQGCCLSDSWRVYHGSVRNILQICQGINDQSTYQTLGLVEFRGTPWLMGSPFPYYSHTIPIRNPNSMEYCIICGFRVMCIYMYIYIYVCVCYMLLIVVYVVCYMFDIYRVLHMRYIYSCSIYICYTCIYICVCVMCIPIYICYVYVSLCLIVYMLYVIC